MTKSKKLADKLGSSFAIFTKADNIDDSDVAALSESDDVLKFHSGVAPLRVASRCASDFL